MAHRVGLCTNIIYCSFASARQDIQVAVDAKFVCPKCGKPLSDMPATAAARRGRIAVIAGGGLALIGGALVVVGALFGHGSAPATALERASSVPLSAAHPQTAIAQAAQQPVKPAPAPLVNQAASARLPAAPSQPAATRVAMIQPAPPPAQTNLHPAAPPAAPALSDDAQVRADLLAKQAADAKATQQAQAAKQAQVVKEAKVAQAERDARATREAEDERTAQLARAAQEAKAAHEAQAEQMERAAQEAREALAAAAAAKPAAQVQVAALSPPPKPAPKPAGPDRAFSAAPLLGGAPTYPDAYESEGRSGQVAVSCRIDTTGHPSGCHVLGAKGGAAFETAVLSWLGSGRVRYAPVLHAGVPVAETHEWTMNFQP